jgi:hypothetical protein
MAHDQPSSPAGLLLPHKMRTIFINYIDYWLRTYSSSLAPH